MTIKVRGNTSARYAKKPFKIKLEKKADLLLRNDKNLRDKNWVLLRDANQLLEAGFIIGDASGLQWAPAYEWVNVIINSDYRGVYLLAEAVERNETCRIRTAETGFVTERDAYWWNENGEYLNSCWLPQFGWTMKYPDFEDFTEEQKSYVQNTLFEFENVLNTSDYENLVDIDSFCQWLICQDILGTSDGGGTNLYIAKYDNTPESKLFVPVLWDVDSAEEAIDRWSGVHGEPVIKLLFENENRSFLKHYVQLYNEVSNDLYTAWRNSAEKLLTEEYLAYNNSAKLNNVRWSEAPDKVNYASINGVRILNWIESRKSWLDKTVDELESSLARVPGISDDTDAFLNVSIEGDLLQIDSSHPEVSIWRVDGRMIYSGCPGVLDLPDHGVYVIRSGELSKKFIF